MADEYEVWKSLWRRSGPRRTFLGCRSVENFKRLNKIEEGTYGIVYRGQDLVNGDIVALKKLKLSREKEGFPITSIREIGTLSLYKHENIVNVREVVVGRDIEDVFIVMDFVAHDFKTLLDENLLDDAFTVSEVKTLMQQLFRGISYLHEHWLVHRDIKTTNLLFSHEGQVKIADFGLARKYGEPLPQMTPLVVTLWYRSPELLLGEPKYTTAVDIWSLGCIMAELILKKPLFQGQGEIDQLYQIFKTLGVPNEKIWPGFSSLPHFSSFKLTLVQPYNYLRQKVQTPKLYVSDLGMDLLNRCLAYNPKRRITAQKALEHEWFREEPRPKASHAFPMWPSRAEVDKKRTPVNNEIEHDDKRIWSSFSGDFV